MAQPLVVGQSRAIPVGPEAAFSGTVPIPLPTLFHRWYGPIPPIKEVRDQAGDWNAVGTGTRVTWRWTIHPKSSFAAPLLPVFGKLWMGYARQSLETLSDQLVH